MCVFAMNIHTITNQYENPALVQLLSYVSIAYSFGADKLFFDTKFMPLQIYGLLIVLAFNVMVVSRRVFCPQK